MDKSKFGKRYEGKVAIVTASTQGIGFSIAKRLGLEGASVVVSSRKQVLGFFALIHLGFLNSSQTWFLFFYSYVSLSLIWNFWVLCCFGFEEMNFYLSYA